MTRRPDPHTWTDAEIAIVREMDASGDSVADIAERLGLSIDQARYALYRARREGRDDDAPVSSRAPPHAVLVDRERRIAARNRQTLTGELFGDPPPGFSMLDRRSAEP
jgi:transposase